MKKTTLVIWFIVLFGFYVAYEKFSPVQTVALAPTNQTQNQTATSGSSGSSGAPLATTSSPPPNPTTASASGSASVPASKPSGQYKDGTYTGGSANAYYGNVKVQAVVQGGKLTNVTFLDYPQSHQVSVYINSQAMPYLTQEAIQAQSANVNIVSGATFTSEAFIQSLASALGQAKNS
jgi:uncharacterized protein with FMN-binding domain